MRKFHYIFLLYFLFSWGCNDPLERYEAPDWIDGSLWVTLEETGEHTSFLEGVDLIGYKRALNGKGNYTVVAPNDDAFSNYLSANGYSSVSDIPLDVLEVLITSHILNKGIKGENLVNLNNNGAGFEHLESAGQNVHYTVGMKTPSVEVGADQQSYGIYHGKKLLSFFSKTKFDILGIADGQSSYEFIFPNEYDESSYFASNAKLISEPISAENGYIYLADQVIEPLFTANEILGENSSLAVELFNSFIKYTYRSDYTSRYAETVGRDSVYIKEGKAGVFSLSKDFTENPSYHAAYSNVASLFVPNNVALEEYMQTTLGISAGEIDEIPVLAAKYLLQGWVSKFWALPEQIEKGQAVSTVGDPIILDLDTDVDFAQLGSNALVYSTNNVVVTNILLGVTGPAFASEDLKDMSAFIEYSERLIQISGMEVDFTLFIPSNSAIEKNSLYWNDWGETKSTAEAAVKISGSEPIEKAEVADVKLLVDRHIAIGKFEVDTEPVYINTMSPYHVIYLDGNTVRNGDNLPDEDIPIIENTFEQTNGISYQLNNVLLETGIEDLGSSLQANFNKFHGYLESAGLLGYLNTEIGGGAHFNIFAPTDEALTTAENAGEIPTDPEELKNFLEYFIISMNANGKTDYFLPAYEYDSSPAFTISKPSGAKDYGQVSLTSNGLAMQLSNNDKTETADVVNDKIYVVIGSVVEGIDDIITLSNN